MSEDINDYLKDGETPLDAIKRERRSTDNLLRHLAGAKQRIEGLVQQCEKLRAERNAVRVKVEQPLLLRIRKLEDVIEQMALSTNTFEVMRLVDKAWQEIIDRQEPPQ